MSTAMAFGLISILSIPTILKVLITTGKSDTAMKAYRRYVQTIYHVLAWERFDLQPGTKAWQSLEIVRKKHLNARRYCEHAKGITITQSDMVVTQFGFIGYAFLYPEKLGIYLADVSELEDVIHFWRVLGHLLGIKDEFNLCTKSVTATLDRLKDILDGILRPALETPPTGFDHMTRAFTSGLWHFAFSMEHDLLIFFTKELAGCKGYEYYTDGPITKEVRDSMQYYKLSLYQKCMAWIYVRIPMLMRFSPVRVCLNFNSMTREWINYYFPITAIYEYGVKSAYVRIFPSEKKKLKI